MNEFFFAVRKDIADVFKKKSYLEKLEDCLHTKKGICAMGSVDEMHKIQQNLRLRIGSEINTIDGRLYFISVKVINK